MGHAFGSLDELGEGYGFRKIRAPLGVTAFGVNAIVMPPGYTGSTTTTTRRTSSTSSTPGQARVEVEGEERVLGPAGSSMPSRRRRAGCRTRSETEDLVMLVVGGKGGLRRARRPHGRRRGHRAPRRVRKLWRYDLTALKTRSRARSRRVEAARSGRRRKLSSTRSEARRAGSRIVSPRRTPAGASGRLRAVARGGSEAGSGARNAFGHGADEHATGREHTPDLRDERVRELQVLEELARDDRHRRLASSNGSGSSTFALHRLDPERRGLLERGSVDVEPDDRVPVEEVTA